MRTLRQARQLLRIVRLEGDVNSTVSLGHDLGYTQGHTTYTDQSRTGLDPWGTTNASDPSTGEATASSASCPS